MILWRKDPTTLLLVFGFCLFLKGIGQIEWSISFCSMRCRMECGALGAGEGQCYGGREKEGGALIFGRIV